MTGLPALLTVLECIDRVNRRDFRGLEAIVVSDVAVMTVPGFGPARNILGLRDVEAFFAQAADVGVAIHVEPYEIKVPTTRSVVVHADYVLRSGDALERLAVWIVYRLRDGRIASIVPFLDRREALDSASLAIEATAG